MWKTTKGTQVPEPWEKYWSTFPEKQFFSLKMSYPEDWLASWKMHAIHSKWTWESYAMKGIQRHLFQMTELRNFPI